METPSSPPLDNAGTLRIQQLVGAIHYYANVVDNKILVDLSKLVQKQSSPTNDTNKDMLQLLDCLATYPNDGITYSTSNMILAKHADTEHLNVTQSRSRAGAQIMLSEDVPIPLHNGPVFTISQIIKNVMSYASEAELAGLFNIAKEMAPLRQALIKTGWPQPKTHIKCNNSTEVGVTNKTIIPCRTNSTDMKFHWLRCRESQK